MGLFNRENEGKGRVVESGEDAFGIVVGYLKQEILDPLRGLGRFVAYGLAGSVALCIAAFLCLLGLLRLLQGETGSTFTGDLDWIPYGIVALVGLAVMGLAGWRIFRGPAIRRLPKAEPRAEQGAEAPELAPATDSDTPPGD